MNFYAAQEQARRKTRWLVVLFVLAILSLVVLTNLFIMFFAEYSTDYYVQGHTPTTFWEKFDWARFIWIGVGVTVVILLGSFIRTLTLKDGGSAIAEMMGARLVSGNPRDALEKRLLNVVEEMAIAAGTPVPQVYVMDAESGINAFAAGYGTGDAVVTVTRGALEKLNRAELQGVIGHEFSHIVNGDMRLNIRLIGILFGILMVALIGRMLLRWGAFSSSGSRGRDNNASVPLVLLGLGLLILGYVGVFFGNLIKASVSRQREYLADASSVQFTREPQGIAGALKKIGGDAEGSLIRHPDAEELSHAYFGEGIHYLFGFNSLFATHPPLEKRILRLDPHWDGEFILPEPQSAIAVEQEEEQRHRPDARDIAAGAVVLTNVLNSIEQATAARGQSELEQAGRLLDAIPQPLEAAAHEPHGARALIYALVLHQDSELLQRQLDHLREYADTGVAEATERHMEQVARLDPSLRLALVDMALPALRQLSPRQYRLFRDNLLQLVEMDGHISPFEWALKAIVLRNLAMAFEGGRPPLGRYNSLRPLKKEIAIMLGYLVHYTHDGGMARLHAFQAGLQAMGLAELEPPPEEKLTAKRLDLAMARLAQLRPLRKPLLLKGCAAAVAADGRIEPLERELLRAFSSLLDCPLPPLDR